MTKLPRKSDEKMPLCTPAACLLKDICHGHFIFLYVMGIVNSHIIVNYILVLISSELLNKTGI